MVEKKGSLPSLWAHLTLVMLISFTGCETRKTRPKIEIFGTVTIDGQPLDEGSIHFSSPKTGETTYSNIDTEGNYSVSFEAADIGEAYEVAIGPTIANQNDVPASQLVALPKMSIKIPKRYSMRHTSGLTTMIEHAGRNQFDCTLKTP